MRLAVCAMPVVGSSSQLTDGKPAVLMAGNWLSLPSTLTLPGRPK